MNLCEPTVYELYECQFSLHFFSGIKMSRIKGGTKEGKNAAKTRSPQEYHQLNWEKRKRKQTKPTKRQEGMDG